MALSTSFSLEEMEYLRGLPTVIAADKPEMRQASRTSWARVAGVKGIGGCGPECEMFIHVPRLSDGSFFCYLRHGEAILRAGACREDGIPIGGIDAYKRAADWIQAIHAHEAATR